MTLRHFSVKIALDLDFLNWISRRIMKKLIATFVIGLLLAFTVIGVSANTNTTEENTFAESNQRMQNRRHRKNRRSMIVHRRNRMRRENHRDHRDNRRDHRDNRRSNRRDRRNN